MLNVLEADTKDFQKVVNNILIEVKPMRLRGKISDDFLGYVNKLRNQITDLEAKLAESERSKEINIKERDKICLEMATDYNKQILELKQQLAEKEKEYKLKLKEMDNEYKKEFKTFEEDCKHLYKTPTKKAIEELEQLKHDIWTNQQDDGWLDEKVDIYELTEMIDQQIKELKGDKNG